MKTDKLTFKTHISANWRAVKLLHSLVPGLLPSSAVKALLSAVQPLLVLFFSARLLDELAGGRDLGIIALYAALAVGVTFAVTAVGAVLDKINDMSSFQSGHMRTIMTRAEHYASLDFEHVEDSRVRELMTEIYGYENWNSFGILRIMWIAPSLFSGVFGVITTAAMLSGMLRGAGAETLPLLFAPAVPVVLGVLLSRYAEGKMNIINSAMPKNNAMGSYYLGGYLFPEKAGKDIRIFKQQPAIENIFSRDGFRETRRRMTRLGSMTSGILGLTNSLIGAAAYIIIGFKALSGAFTLGQVTQYVGAVTLFTGAVTGLVSTLTNFAQNTPFLQKLYDFLDLPKLKYGGTLTTEKRADNEYELEFKNVSFRYPGTTDYALKDLNLKLHIGRKMAVVGMNGSGKTTMIKLLCRLYDPTEGEITLNGIDIKKYDYREYMNLFAVVFQDFKLTGFSLGQNVAAAVDYDAERAARLLKTVGLDIAPPGGGNGEAQKLTLETPLYKSFDKNGTEISGGEAQKIALARALYRACPVIILDEPTAALDPIAESEIYEKFDGLVGESTAIYISHRLSSCRFCDDIAVFDGGELVQRGSHDALLEDKTGKYHELWNAQAQYYE
ncbi:MAG: ABC transporter ATP-binding protein/permease [Oscillospiraceae bacterium]|jgi:ATP-binding cassette subfamily B protein|nr:ABC transporter ATP-binding protein/permease [Oscillospiraceae bacterium]